MKKIISLILSVLFIMSVSVTGFASEKEATPDSAEIETQIKKDASEHLYNGDISVDDIMVTVFGTLSDGSMLVNVCRYSSHYTVTYMCTLGDYVYSYQPGDKVYLYKNNMFYFVVDAYYDGIINDSMLKEISKLSEESLNNSPNSKYFHLCPLENSEGQIIKDVSEYFHDGKVSIDDIVVIVFGTLSDGSVLINEAYGDSPDVTFEHTLGNYKYVYNAGEEVYLYKNNTFRFIVDAYNDGMLSDSMLKELSILSEESIKAYSDPDSIMAFCLYPIEPDTTDIYPTEAETQATSVQLTESTTQAQPTTPPVTVAVAESTTGDVTNTTKPGASSDTVINNNSNGAVQTGQNSVILFVFVMTVISAALVFALIKHRYYK